MSDNITATYKPTVEPVRGDSHSPVMCAEFVGGPFNGRKEVVGRGTSRWTLAVDVFTGQSAVYVLVPGTNRFKFDRYVQDASVRVSESAV